MCVCACACMYACVCMHACVRVCMHACVYACMCVCVRVDVLLHCIYLCGLCRLMRAYAHTVGTLYSCVFVCMSTFLCIDQYPKVRNMKRHVSINLSIENILHDARTERVDVAAQVQASVVGETCSSKDRFCGTYFLCVLLYRCEAG